MKGVVFMDAIEILSKIMETKGVTNAKLGKAIGCSGDIVYQRKKQKNISVKVLNQMLCALDYEIVIQPTTSGRRADGVYVIENRGK
jgi:hypothetical protein